jgi:hypothetical protein
VSLAHESGIGAVALPDGRGSLRSTPAVELAGQLSNLSTDLRELLLTA